MSQFCEQYPANILRRQIRGKGREGVPVQSSGEPFERFHAHVGLASLDLTNVLEAEVRLRRQLTLAEAVRLSSPPQCRAQELP